MRRRPALVLAQRRPNCSLRSPMPIPARSMFGSSIHSLILTPLRNTRSGPFLPLSRTRSIRRRDSASRRRLPFMVASQASPGRGWKHKTSECSPPRQVSGARGLQNALACTLRPSSTTMCSEGSSRRRSSIIKSCCYDYWVVESYCHHIQCRVLGLLGVLQRGTSASEPTGTHLCLHVPEWIRQVERAFRK